MWYRGRVLIWHIQGLGTLLRVARTHTGEKLNFHVLSLHINLTGHTRLLATILDSAMSPEHVAVCNQPARFLWGAASFL